MWYLETPSFDINELLYDYKISWNTIMKGIEILILKSFGIVYEKSMVEEWCEILIIHK